MLILALRYSPKYFPLNSIDKIVLYKSSNKKSMEYIIGGQKYDIPDDIILGTCKVCKLPLTTYEIYDVLVDKIDEKILFQLVNVCGDIHESCLEKINRSKYLS